MPNEQPRYRYGNYNRSMVRPSLTYVQTLITCHFHHPPVMHCAINKTVYDRRPHYLTLFMSFHLHQLHQYSPKTCNCWQYNQNSRTVWRQQTCHQGRQWSRRPWTSTHCPRQPQSHTKHGPTHTRQQLHQHHYHLHNSLRLITVTSSQVLQSQASSQDTVTSAAQHIHTQLLWYNSAEINHCGR